MIMAILDGAVLTAIQEQVSDLIGSINLAYFVPLVCFIVIAYYGASRLSQRFSDINLSIIHDIKISYL